jgi:hypothetical protein
MNADGPRPIPTRYKGYHFRSRLEARWAIFFDHLRLDWEFEPQGYVVEGTPYLPDFKLILPGDRLAFAEVKNAETDWHVGRPVQLCRALARETGWPVILLIGIPAYRAYHQFTPTLASDAFQAVFFRDYEPKIVEVDGYWWTQIEIDSRTGALDFRHDDYQARKSFGQGLVDAVRAARSARFEHGAEGVRPSDRDSSEP